jgi:hypothetical protein
VKKTIRKQMRGQLNVFDWRVKLKRKITLIKEEK